MVCVLLGGPQWAYYGIDLPKKTEAAVGVVGIREPKVGGGAEPEPESESSHLGVQLFMRSGGQIFTRLC